MILSLNFQIIVNNNDNSMAGNKPDEMTMFMVTLTARVKIGPKGCSNFRRLLPLYKSMIWKDL